MDADTLAHRVVAGHEEPHAPQGVAGYIAILCVLVVFLVGFGLFFYVQMVISTLASVETSGLTSSIALAEATDERYNDNDNLDGINEDNIGLLGKTQKFAAGNGMTTLSGRPLTSSVRRTISHLRTLNGFGKGFLRGFRHMLAVAFLQTVVQCLVTLPTSRTTGMAGTYVLTPLAALIATVFAAGPRVSVTHAIVSATPKSFLQRFPPVKTWTYVIWPSCFAFFCFTLSSSVPFFLNALTQKIFPASVPSGEGDGEVEISKPAIIAALVTNLINIIFIITFYYYVLIPTSIAVTRVEASLLPAYDETIIPFDRTFGDRAKFTGVDDRKVLSLMDAWRSVTAADRRRVAVLTLKLLLIGVAFVAVGAITMFGTLLLVSGGDIKQFLDDTLAKLQR